jgi:predicted permease
MILDSLAPVFALILLGKLLEHFDLTGRRFAQTSDRLVYYIFFPALLFWKIGGLPLETALDWKLCQATVFTIIAGFLIGLGCIRILDVSALQAGAFSQSGYRANTYIGMAVVINALGEDHAGRFGMYLGLVIPLVNVLAVSTLIWFSGKKPSLPQRLLVTGKALLGNPLILACLAGLLFARMETGFPLFLENTLQLAASMSLPLALISIGGSLSTAALKGRLKLAALAAVFKVLVFPVIGFIFLWLLDVDNSSFRMGMIFFALPIAPSAYVLAAQLHSDTELASAAIVLSTVLGLFSLPAVMWITQ